MFIGRTDAEYFGHLMERTNSVEKDLMLGKIKGRRSRGQHRMRWLDHQLNGHEFEQFPVMDREAWRAAAWARKESDRTV